MFSRRSFFAALGLTLPMIAAVTAEAATPRAPARKRRSTKAATSKRRRVEAETVPAAKG